MYKANLLLSFGLAAAMTAMAELPTGYYTLLEGKRGEELRAAVKKAAIPDNYFIVKYGDSANTDFNDGYEHTLVKSWQVFATSDVRTFNGEQIWWDMYSNQLVRVETGHASMNIEHSVANSWWGGENGNLQAYSDLMHLNPSDGTANNAKSDNPMGKVAGTPTFDNGISLIGAPAAGYGGGASKVFEPADEYKGDFARAYLYIFTAYDDISWLDTKGGIYMLTIPEGGAGAEKGKAEMQQWVIDMLLDWAAKDPVDDKEISRNNEIYKYQFNRNPFIDFPDLPQYIWGSKKGEKFSISGSEASAINRPADPKALDARVTNVNTYSISYWGNKEVEFDAPDGDLWISLDGGEYQRYGSRISVPAGTVHDTTHTLKAYAMQQKDGHELRSSIVTVNLTVKDPSIVDYTTAVWTPAKAGDEIVEGEKYVLVSSNNSHVMSCKFGSNGFMEDAGAAELETEDITIIPKDAALVDFIDAGNGNYAIHISDIYGQGKGYWTTTSAKKMKLDTKQGTSATIGFNEDMSAKIDFDLGGSASLGTLQYNKSNPRFLNYTSAQGAVMLYRFKGFASEDSAVDEIGQESVPVVICGRDIIAPDGSMIFDLNGRSISGRNLQNGVYIVVTPTGSVKVLIQ